MGNQIGNLFSKASRSIWKGVFNAGSKIAEDLEEFNVARAGINGAANPAGARMHATGRGIDLAMGMVTHPLTTVAKVAGIGAVGGVAGIGLLGLGVAGGLAYGAVNVAGRLARHALPAAPRSALSVGGVALGSIAKTLGGAELVARTVLTGGIRGVDSPLDAWLPNYRNMGADKLAKYALNSRIANRVLIGAVGVGLAGALSQAITPKAPPASAYYDGVRMRRIGDLGATASYGRRVMNSANSFSNLDYRSASQSLVHLL